MLVPFRFDKQAACRYIKPSVRPLAQSSILNPRSSLLLRTKDQGLRTKMKCLVTGAAGFIGSHLCERLLQAGHAVVGADAFIPYYPRPLKEANLKVLRDHSSFRFYELDLRRDPLDDMLEGVEVVYHLAAMAGLAKSWTDFDLYETCNIAATQRLV